MFKILIDVSFDYQTHLVEKVQNVLHAELDYQTPPNTIVLLEYFPCIREEFTIFKCVSLDCPIDKLWWKYYVN